MKSAEILKNMIALLPERGFIQTISYTGAGTLTMTVQFDTSREAAYFYKTLLDEEWIADAKLSSIAASEPEAKADSDVNSETNEQFVPRYTGQYSITLNRDMINAKEMTKTDKVSEQGGDEL